MMRLTFGLNDKVGFCPDAHASSASIESNAMFPRPAAVSRRKCRRGI
jgi:hypothetical protein